MARIEEQLLSQASLIQKITEILPNAGDILEVAPGSGYLAIELSKSGHYQVVELDISKTFIEIVQSNAKKANADVHFQHGNASRS